MVIALDAGLPLQNLLARLETADWTLNVANHRAVVWLAGLVDANEAKRREEMKPQLDSVRSTLRSSIGWSNQAIAILHRLPPLEVASKDVTDLLQRVTHEVNESNVHCGETDLALSAFDLQRALESAIQAKCHMQQAARLCLAISFEMEESVDLGEAYAAARAPENAELQAEMEGDEADIPLFD